MLILEGGPYSEGVHCKEMVDGLYSEARRSNDLVEKRTVELLTVVSQPSNFEQP